MQDNEIRGVILENFYLELKEFRIQRELSTRGRDNKTNFQEDRESGKLKRYIRGFVAYKDGILCGHHNTNRTTLETYTCSRLTRTNLDIFPVAKEDN